jgi:hypothetical protein
VHGLVAGSNVDGAAHNLSAIAIIALVSGHLYMAVPNPGTRAEHHPAWRPDDCE